MKRLMLLSMFFIVSSSLYSQEIFFNIGKNYSRLNLNYSGSANVNELSKSGVGDSYEIGYAIPIRIQRLDFDNNFNYTISLTLNQHNAYSGDSKSNFTWNVDYAGIKNSLNFSFIKTNNIDLAVKAGVTTSTLISGTQTINNSRFNLKNKEDFNGILIFPTVGIQAKCNLSEYGYLSIGYNYSKSMSLTNKTDKKINFLTNQILFGISFELY